MSVIFLAGVHGVGKGFLGTLLSNSLGIVHLTASGLIREKRGHATWGIDKNTSNLDANQLALIRAVGQERLTHPRILLDGHFVLRNAQGVLTPLPTVVFKELRLTGVILLTEEASIIAGRLALRDNGTPDEKAISELAAAEMTNAKAVCKKLGLPLSILHAPTLAGLTEAVTKFLSS